jgi:hypothetical protein
MECRKCKLAFWRREEKLIIYTIKLIGKQYTINLPICYDFIHYEITINCQKSNLIDSCKMKANTKNWLLLELKQSLRHGLVIMPSQ